MRCIKLIKYHSKDTYMLSKDSISNKCCSFELLIHKLYILFKSRFPQILNWTCVFNMNINYVSWAQNQHIRMISEGSRDTEDWSNGWWKLSFAIALNKNKERNKWTNITCVYIYVHYSNFLTVRFLMFLKNDLLLTKPAFIWSKVQQKQ